MATEGKFEIQLLNQISDSEHCSRILTYDDEVPDKYTTQVIEANIAKLKGWGYPRFILNEDLNKITPTCQYLKDDCLFFQVFKV